jgi:hypothetical protein
MISEACDLAEFFRNVETRDIQDVIYTAEQEATSAERSLYHPRRCQEANRKDCREYVEALKSLIGYLRYHVRPPISEEWLGYFQHAEMELMRNRRSPKTSPTS